MRGYRGIALALAALGLAACEGKVTTRAKKLERRGDAPPVVMVEGEVRGTTALAAEVEPNDSPEIAQKVEIPGGVRGALSSEGEVDLFRIDPAAAGWLRVEAVSPEIDLEVALVQGKKVLAHSDRGPKAVIEGVANWPVAAGTPVFVRVSEFTKKGRKKESRPDGAYELRAVFTAELPGDAEAEPNENKDGARELLLGQKGTGFIGWTKDIDTWTVSLLGFSAGYVLDLEIRGVAGAHLTVTGFDGTGKALFERKGDAGQTVHVRGLDVSTLGERFAFRLSGSRSNPEDGYAITASSRMREPGEELEPNDEPSAATVVYVEDEREGEARGTVGSGDVDALQLPDPGPSAIANLDLEGAPSADLSLELVQRGRVIAKADDGKDGVRERLAGVPVDAGAPVVVVIRGKASGDAPADYRLRWTLVSGAALDELPPME